MASLERATLGFEGGGVLPVRASREALERLTAALSGAGGWHELEVDDGTVRLDLGKVVYLRTERDDQRVGF
jgi:hypothetical protein